MRVGLVVPTLNAGDRWSRFLAAVASQSVLPDRLLDIDSGSEDQTVEEARRAGFEVVTIDRSTFNHGGTRQWAAEYLVDCDLVVFLTQDAILAEPDTIGNIVASFADPSVAVAYGRQVPHEGATPIEAHARIFNYGPTSLRKDTAAAESMGAAVFFCSNSFSCYRREALIGLGGFKRDLILGEDMEFAARAVLAGYANLYCADAPVFHSHDYGFKETLKRYFDIGVFDSEHRWMKETFGSHDARGKRYVISELRYLLGKSPAQIPKAVLLTAAKWAGYKLGLGHHRLSLESKRRLSTMPGYWQ